MIKVVLMMLIYATTMTIIGLGVSYGLVAFVKSIDPDPQYCEKYINNTWVRYPVSTCYPATAKGKVND